MTLKAQNLTLGLATLLLSACVTNPAVESRPSWIDSPGRGVSASAGVHVRGRVAQEELAVVRAREEFAKRFGVDVQADQRVVTKVSNDRASTVSVGTTQIQTLQRDVRAVVKEKWRDPGSDVIWVWLVPAD